MGHFANGSLENLAEEARQILDSGLTIKVANLISDICQEIKVLYDIEESVRQPDEKEIEGFLYDLSAFLLELECPYEELTCGPLSTRFESNERCNFLFNYLIAELRAARVFAHQRLTSGEFVREIGDKELTPYIASALNTCSVHKPGGSVSETQILDLLTNGVDQRLQKYPNKPVPLFKATLDDKKLSGIEEVCRVLSKDFRNRLVLLLRRLEVTVNSFLWCDRIKPLEAQIREILAARRSDIEDTRAACEIVDLLAASDVLLRVKPAGAAEFRKNTKSKQHPLATGEKPKDRGGRTMEMGGIANESFQQQQATRQQDSHRGGHRGGSRDGWHGGHGRGRDRGGQNRSFEDQVRDEYSHGRGRGGGSSNFRGRGGGGYRGRY